MQNIFKILEDRKTELSDDAHYFAAREGGRERSTSEPTSLHDRTIDSVVLSQCYEKVLDDLKTNWDQLYPELEEAE